MTISNPRELRPGQKLHWHDDSTAEVINLTPAGVLVRWDESGDQVRYPFDDNAWHYFKTYSTDQ